MEPGFSSFPYKHANTNKGIRGVCTHPSIDGLVTAGDQDVLSNAASEADIYIMYMYVNARISVAISQTRGLCKVLQVCAHITISKMLNTIFSEPSELTLSQRGPQ
jgi:hypothetical protein